MKRGWQPGEFSIIAFMNKNRAAYWHQFVGCQVFSGQEALRSSAAEFHVWRNVANLSCQFKKT